MFVTFEGIDGTGKSTQAAAASEWLRGRGEDVVLTREPGGWEGGEILRGMAVGGSLAHPWSEAYLFMLDRAEHSARVISPALSCGKTVVCERYQDSTLAYQVWGRGLPLKIFDELFELSKFPEPDITILFDLDPDEALSRVGRRGSPDAFESCGTPFMSRIRSGYLELAARGPERWRVLDITGMDAGAVTREVVSMLEERMAKHG